jgi:hypothetical protein
VFESRRMERSPVWMFVPSNRTTQSHPDERPIRLELREHRSG